MNIRELIFSISVAMVISWGLQNYFFIKKDASEPSWSFSAQKMAREQNPLNKEVSFFDTKRPSKVVLTELDLSWSHVVFSTQGACIESIEFPRDLENKSVTLRTIFPLDDIDREDRCFLVAFDQDSPYFYNLTDQRDFESTVELEYSAETSQASISKTYIVSKTVPKIDLVVSINPKKDQIIVPRVLFPSPIIVELGDRDVISAIHITPDNVFSKVERSKLEEDKGWLKPVLFGAEDKYFVHALISDSDQFVQRAYYSLKGKHGLFSILEGPEVTTKTEWTLSFYMGPKEDSLMHQVDPRLEKTLDYSGILAPISRALLAILIWLYSYVQNYGLAIILLTLLIKLLLLPLTIRSDKSARQAREVQKKMAYVQQRYKHDADRLAIERAEIIKKHGMPGLGGCLPLLLQAPIFFAMSRILNTAIQLYQAPMLWIPDLSAADPYYILPILIASSMLFSISSVDASQRFSIIVMAVVFGAFATSFSAGLALYLAAGTVLGLVQTYIVGLFKRTS